MELGVQERFLEIPLTAEQVIENALDQAGFGKFHYILIALTASIITSAGLEATVLSIIVPAAKCDFGMTSGDAGLLTSIPLLGMAFGSIIWGALGDIFGRKNVLASCATVGGLVSISSSFCSYFPVFVALRTLSAFCVAGIIALCYTFIGEFLSSKRREPVVCWVDVGWPIGIILVPCLGWFLISSPMRYESAYLTYDSWNVMLLITGSVMLILGLLTFNMLETPKFLYNSGDKDGALTVLRMMYRLNSGKDASTYKIKFIGNPNIGRIMKSAQQLTVGNTFSDLTYQIKTLFSAEYIKTTVLSSFIFFGINAVYFTMIMWLPELFSRFRHFELMHPGVDTSVCQVASVFIDTGETAANETASGCVVRLDHQVFSHSITIGLSCLPFGIALPLLVKRFGLKFFILIPQLVACFVCLALFLVKTSLQNLIVSCVFEAFVAVSFVALWIALIELFPTKIRAAGGGFTIAFGRFGGLFGNMGFGYLIDNYCVVPISLFAAILATTTVASWFLGLGKEPNKVKRPT